MPHPFAVVTASNIGGGEHPMNRQLITSLSICIRGDAFEVADTKLF